MDLPEPGSEMKHIFRRASIFTIDEGNFGVGREGVARRSNELSGKHPAATRAQREGERELETGP